MNHLGDAHVLAARDEIVGHHVAHGDDGRVEFGRYHREHDIAVRNDADRPKPIMIGVRNNQVTHVMLPHQLSRFLNRRIAIHMNDASHAHILHWHIGLPPVISEARR